MIVLTHLSGNYTGFDFNPTTSYPNRKHDMILLLALVERYFNPSSLNVKNKFPGAKENILF